MLTLDEAIKHCEEKAKELRKQVDTHMVVDAEEIGDCIECANEHEQLAEWLKDYKRLLEWEKDVKGKAYRNEHCDRAGKCIDYIGWHCSGCNNAKE